MNTASTTLSMAALIALAGASSAQFTPTLEARSSFSSNYRWVSGSAGFDDVRLGEDGSIGFFGDVYDFSTYSGTYSAWFGQIGGVDTGTEIYETTSDEIAQHSFAPDDTPVYYVETGFSSGEYRTFDGSSVSTGPAVVPGGSLFGLSGLGALADGSILQEVQQFNNDRLVQVDSVGTVTEYFNQNDLIVPGSPPTPLLSGFVTTTDGYADDGKIGVTGFINGGGTVFGQVGTDGNFVEIGRTGGVDFDGALNTTRTSAGGNLGLQATPTGESEQMLLWDGVSLTTLVTEGVEVGTFSSFGVDVNDRGDAIFIADNADGDDTLFFYDFRGFLLELASIGDTVFDPSSSSDISITSFSSTFLLNNRGDVLARVSTSAGSSLISFAQVPAPGAAGLLGLAGLAAARRRR